MAAMANSSMPRALLMDSRSERMAARLSATESAHRDDDAAAAAMAAASTAAAAAWLDGALQRGRKASHRHRTRNGECEEG